MCYPLCGEFAFLCLNPDNSVGSFLIVEVGKQARKNTDFVHTADGRRVRPDLRSPASDARLSCSMVACFSLRASTRFLLVTRLLISIRDDRLYVLVIDLVCVQIYKVHLALFHWCHKCTCLFSLLLTSGTHHFFLSGFFCLLPILTSSIFNSTNWS